MLYYPLHIAVQYGKLDSIKELLKEKVVDINGRDHHGNSPLFWAAAKGRVDVVKLLLEEDHVDPNLQDSFGRTPLSAAAKNKHTNVVKLLLENGRTNPNFQNKSGWTPLFYDIKNGHDIVVKLLLQRDNIDLNLQDTHGRTPIFQAAESRHKKCFQLLLNAGMNESSKARPSRTPLSWATENGYESVVKMLLEDGADPNIYDEDGGTPLLRAFENGLDETIGLLIQHDRTTLHLLVQKGEVAPVKSIIDAGYDINTANYLSQTALHVAISSRHFEIATMLISSGSDVNTKDINGVTPLRLAILSRQRNFIELLLTKTACTKGITVNEWLDAYEKSHSKTVVSLSVGTNGGIRLRFIEETMGSLPAEPETESRLLLFPDHSTWSRCLTSNPTKTSGSKKEKVIYTEQINSSDIKISVTVWTPQRTSVNTQTSLDFNWAQHGVAWTITAPTKQNGRSYWKTKNFFSMLPNGWIPEEGIDLFRQVIAYLTKSWSELCYTVEEDLSKRRIDQLSERGQSPDFISRLAKDAKSLAELRSSFRDQVRTARGFVVDYCRRYGESEHAIVLQEIESFSEVSRQIDQLDQTIRDLLQLEFAWVSVNEAHKSTSIATSMKRLSWITFIFLPAMFASSLFGMNVDILQDNPDWRWYILLGGVFFILTVLGWLFFKFVQVEEWMERNVGVRLKRWTSKQQQDRTIV